MCNTLAFLHLIHILPCVKIRKCLEFKADGIMQMIDTKSKGFCKSNHEFAKSSFRPSRTFEQIDVHWRWYNGKLLTRVLS